MSGRGPSAVIFHGVWQSWQPDVETMYLPRATALGDVAGAAGSAARANDANSTSAKNANNFRDFIETSSN